MGSDLAPRKNLPAIFEDVAETIQRIIEKAEREMTPEVSVREKEATEHTHRGFRHIISREIRIVFRPNPPVVQQADEECISALANLGYSRSEAMSALKGTTGATEDRVRQALQILGDARWGNMGNR